MTHPITSRCRSATDKLAASGSAAASAQATATCTWGGTPASPTGKVWYSGQGVTNTPSTEPLPFIATGPLAGDCSGTLTYHGVQAAGATCAFGPFEARATGLPGVVRAAGDNVVGLVPALLYDPHGKKVFTLDRRDFATYRPAKIGHFTLLPAR